MSSSSVPNAFLLCHRCSSNRLLPKILTNMLANKSVTLTSSNFQISSQRRIFTTRHASKNTFGALKLLSSDQKTMNKVVSDAEKIVGYPTSFLSLRCLLSDELSNVAMQMRQLVGTKHPLLKTARGLVMDGRKNMQMRGLLVMLIAKAAGPNPDKTCPNDKATSGIYNSQRSLAEITEVIHTANLIHKGVVNLDKVLPEEGSLHDMAFGNKMAVLSGDYLLASACSGLADLGNPTVVENVASSIGDMMTAEFTQFTDDCGKPTIPETTNGFSDWLQQTYLAVGSLLSKSCEAALILSGHSKQLQEMAFNFGKYLTFSHQLSQDILPFIQKDEIQNLSFTSGPILMYKERASAEEFSQIQQLWEGGSSNYSKIVSDVTSKGILELCREHCEEYRQNALSSLDAFPDSDAKSALIRVVNVMSEPSSSP